LFNSGITGTGQWVTPTAISHTNANHSMTETSDGIFRSTNGSTWSNVSSHNAVWIDYSRVDGNYVWTVIGSVASYTTNHGSTWNTAPSISPGISVAGSATKILAHPTDLNTVFVTFSGYNANAHIVRSTDLGATWEDVSGDFTGQPVNAIAIDPDSPTDWYIGTDVGVWHSNNGGVNWLPFETGLPNAVVVDLEIRSADDKLVAGTHGRGAWEVDIPPSGVVSADVTVDGARNLMLDSPSPNPVSNRTLLRYAAKSNAPVSLKIYDVNGRLVSDLEDFSQGDGIIRTTPWFTDDVPTGVYFAVLKAGGVQKSQKITVIK
ncbi:MAG: T9SS type A sorting domain-containing protein, partial [Gemmatimonadetes bacterium]|nr:T9SS type A sorting domain-containing protein [Gemmatimonadota bacterium]